MCGIIVINRGEIEIETPRQFQNHFGFLPEKEEYFNNIELDCCLCQGDLDATFMVKNIDYKTDCMDYYVGQLDKVDVD